APPPAPPPESIPLRPDVPSIPLTKEPAPKPAPPPPKVDPPAPPPLPVGVRKGIPGLTPEAIDQAIERGAEWLKRQQTPTGSWVLGGKYPIGYAALPGLTLLECK